MRLGYFNLPETHPAYYLIYGTAQVVAGLYLIWAHLSSSGLPIRGEMRSNLTPKKNRTDSSRGKFRLKALAVPVVSIVNLKL